MLEYGSVIFDSSTTMSDKMENVQRRAALAISGACAQTTAGQLPNYYSYLIKIIGNLTPLYLKALIPRDISLHAFIPSSIRLWNELSQTLQMAKEIKTFRTALKKIFTLDLLYKLHCIWPFKRMCTSR